MESKAKVHKDVWRRDWRGGQIRTDSAKCPRCGAINYFDVTVGGGRRARFASELECTSCSNIFKLDYSRA